MIRRPLTDAEYLQAGAISRRTYEASGRNGYTGVDVFLDGRCMRGPVFTGTRKAAASVAAELADAYAQGLSDAIIALNDARTMTLAERGIELVDAREVDYLAEWNYVKGR